MSIIGPRPLLVSYLPWYTEEEKQRHLLGVNVVFFDKMQDLSKKILTITEKIQKEQKKN